MNLKKGILLVIAVLFALLIGIGGVNILAGGSGIFIGTIFLVVGAIGAYGVNRLYEK